MLKGEFLEHQIGGVNGVQKAVVAGKGGEGKRVELHASNLGERDSDLNVLLLKLVVQGYLAELAKGLLHAVKFIDDEVQVLGVFVHHR